MFRGRRFSSDDLQLMLLARLKDGQSHGYQLIKALADLSGGVYTPSPGMVYPALTYLEEIGFADVALVGNKKLYSLSEAGKAHLEASSARVGQLTEMLGFMSQRARAMRDNATEDAFDEGSSLMKAHRALREVLLATRRGPVGNHERIAEILQRAASEIEALGKSPD